MDIIINIIINHAPIAHFIAFIALVLAGCHLPISEDAVVMISGIIAFTVIPENAYKICTAIFLGCVFSDNISYWTGRLLGRRLWELKWFNKIISQKRLSQAEHFYQKHGFKTIIFGRFIPFGIRHCLSLTAGIGKMRYNKFILVDTFACMLTNIALLSLSYYVGKNYENIFHWLKTFKFLVFSVFLCIIILFSIFYIRRRKKLKVLQK